MIKKAKPEKIYAIRPRPRIMGCPIIIDEDTYEEINKGIRKAGYSYFSYNVPENEIEAGIISCLDELKLRRENLVSLSEDEEPKYAVYVFPGFNNYREYSHLLKAIEIYYPALCRPYLYIKDQNILDIFNAYFKRYYQMDLEENYNLSEFNR